MSKLNIFFLMSISLSATISAQVSDCVPEYSMTVFSAQDLEELLEIAQNVSSNAEQTLKEWQNTTKHGVEERLPSISDRILSFHFKYDNKVWNIFYCNRHVNNAYAAYKKGKDQLESILGVDHIPSVKRNFDKPMEDNVKYIQKLIADCKTSPCKDEAKLKDGMKRLLDVHKSWCSDVNTLLNDDENNAANIEKRTINDINDSDKWLQRLFCTGFK